MDPHVPVVTISDGTTTRPPDFRGNYYNFDGTLDLNLNCRGRVDFKRIFDKGGDGKGHPFKLCVGGVQGSDGPGSKCNSAHEEGCGIKCFDYQVGDVLSEDGDCTSIDVAGRELWYVCTVDSHDMYNRLC